MRPMQFCLPAQRHPFANYYDEIALAGAPASFKSAPVNARGYPEARFTLQFYVEDCTGCGLCVEACPAISPREPDVKAINLAEKAAAAGGRAHQYRVLRNTPGQ